VSNEGTADLVVNATSLLNANADQFSIVSGGAPFTLAPQESRNVVVNFNPTSTGQKSATLRIESDDPDENPLEVSLIGNGVAPPPICDLSVDPISHDFEEVEIGTFVDKTFVLANAAIATTSCDGSASIIGDPAFSIISGENFSIPPGQTHEIVIRFACQQASTNPTAILRLTSNDPEVIDVPLTGTCTAPTAVVINEVVTDPQQDWSDDAGGNGISFDDFPGTGTINDTDEWVELFNAGTQAVNLITGSGWTIEFINGTNEVFNFKTPGTAVLRFSAGGSVTNFQPGEYLVIGNPPGAINNDVFIVLQNQTGAIKDDVEIGNDFEGDGAGDGAPDGGTSDGNATGIDDEAVARFPNGADSGDDVSDFVKHAATIGSSNGELPTGPFFVVINEIVTDPQQDWSDNAGGNGVPFDDIPGNGTISDTDEWIELLNIDTKPINLKIGNGWTIDFNNGSNSTLDFTNLGSAVLRFSAGGSVTNFQPGEFLVIGNPTGTINNDVHIILKDHSGTIVDDVEIGDDFENDGAGDGAPDGGTSNGNATGINDEAVARFPNGVDTDNDVNDFAKQAATIGASNGEIIPAPDIAVTPTAHDYGDVTIGSSSQQTFVVSNEGTADLVVNATSLLNANADQFAIVSGGAPFTLAPQESRNIVVSFNPTSTGQKSATLRLESNDSDENPLDIQLTGNGVEQLPDLAVNPTSLDFGEIEVGKERDLILVITNEGTAALEVTATDLIGADANQWQVTKGAAPFTLASGESREVTICFNPTSEGIKNAGVRFKSNDPDENPFDVDLSGTGFCPSGQSHFVTPVPLVAINGKDFAIKSVGGQDGCGWNLFSNGFISTAVMTTGESRWFVIDVIASSSFAGNAWAKLQLFIDEMLIGENTIANQRPRTFHFPVKLSGGTHQIKLVFPNDFFNPVTKEDRNLIIKQLLVFDSGTPLPTPGSLNAEAMNLKTTGAAIAGGAWNLFSNGFLGHGFAAPVSGNYELKVTASGQSARNESPKMSVLVDGVALDTVEVASVAPHDYRFPLTLAAGNHLLQLEFINDFFDRTTGADRNLILHQFTITSTTPPAPAKVVINEIVSDPQQDWNDSGGGNGIEFDNMPGNGTITETDEWVELFNAGTQAVNLIAANGWTIEFINGTNEIFNFANPGTTVLRFSAGGSVTNFQPGEFVVIGNPPGAINNNVYLVLKDESGAMIDDVEIGNDFEGDGAGDGAPDGGISDGNATGVSDEAVARFPNGVDTENDVEDFTKQAATIGTSNGQPSTAPAVVKINEVVTDPQQDWSDNIGGNGIPFDNIPGAGTITDTDEWIELFNAGTQAVNLAAGSGWSLEFINGTNEIFNFTNPGTTVLRFSAGGSATNFQPGEFVVIGNPPGAINNNVYIVLKDESGMMIDDVEIGNDFEGDGAGDGAPDGGASDGNATGINDEAVARLPNGTDTENDVNDFSKHIATIGAANESAGSSPITTGIGSDAASPQGCILEENFPNPFNPTTKIAFRLPERSHVTLSIHNLTGQEVARLVDNELMEGHYERAWSASSQASGIYLSRFVAISKISGRRVSLVKKMLLTK
jgi:hypothetical protein